MIKEKKQAFLRVYLPSLKTRASNALYGEFLSENQIRFPETYDVEDIVFTIYSISCAKRLVRVPNIVNIYRYRPDSILNKNDEFIPFIKRWVSVLINGFSCCDEFLKKLKFFQKNPSFRYIALDAIVQDIFRRFKKVYQFVAPAEIDELIRAEFAAHGESSAYAAFFFNLSMLYEIQLSHLLSRK